MKKILGAVACTVLALNISACGNNATSNSTTTSAAETTTAPETTAAAETTKVEAITTTVSETSEPTTATSNNLSNYLETHKEGLTYHVLYEIALNPDATTNLDENVTYMFNKDDNGNRVLGNVIAYYTNLKDVDTSSLEKFCISFIDAYFPELNDFILSAETHDDGKYYGKIIYFDDYAITIMPDNSMNGISFIIAENQ